METKLANPGTGRHLFRVSNNLSGCIPRFYLVFYDIWIRIQFCVTQYMPSKKFIQPCFFLRLIVLTKKSIQIQNKKGKMVQCTFYNVCVDREISFSSHHVRTPRAVNVTGRLEFLFSVGKKERVRN